MILDEMNLAHVERYFSDYLSAAESREPVLPNLERETSSGLAGEFGPGAPAAPSDPAESLGGWDREHRRDDLHVLAEGA